MTDFTYTIQHADGVHARPATMLASKLAEYDSCVIKVYNESGKFSNGKSIMGLLTLNVHCGESIRVEIDGPNENHVAAEVEAYIKTIL